MTLCELITKPITRMVEQEGKSLDEIAEAVCPQVEYGREKIIRIIKDFLGDEYLIEHAETLGYDIEKAQLAKKRKQKSHKKIDAIANVDSGNKEACHQQCNKQEPDKQGNKQEPAPDFDELIKEIKRLVDLFSLEDVKKALAVVEG